ncbi:MAG: hypothetical protein ACQEWV_15390 [Bacillota bacterium]
MKTRYINDPVKLESVRIARKNNSFYFQIISVSHEIIIVDNGSDHETVSTV